MTGQILWKKKQIQQNKLHVPEKVKTETASVSLDGAEINSRPAVKFHGIFVDDKFNLYEHIKFLKQKVFFSCEIIWFLFLSKVERLGKDNYFQRTFWIKSSVGQMSMKTRKK